MKELWLCSKKESRSEKGSGNPQDEMVMEEEPVVLIEADVPVVLVEEEADVPAIFIEEEAYEPIVVMNAENVPPVVVKHEDVMERAENPIDGIPMGQVWPNRAPVPISECSGDHFEPHYKRYYRTRWIPQ